MGSNSVLNECLFQYAWMAWEFFFQDFFGCGGKFNLEFKLPAGAPTWKRQGESCDGVFSVFILEQIHGEPPMLEIRMDELTRS